MAKNSDVIFIATKPNFVKEVLEGIKSELTEDKLVVSIAAGITILRPQRVFLFALISAAVWNFIWIYAGYSLGNNWEQVREKFTVIIGSYNIAAVSLIALSVVVYLAVKKSRNRKG